MTHRILDVAIGVILGATITIALTVHGETVSYTAPLEEPREVLIEEEIDWTEERVIEAIRETFPEQPDLMVRVAKCESSLIPHAHNAHTDDGGLFQINDYYHGENLKALGLDRMKVEDNLTYARRLYDANGLRDWSASKHCWNR